MLTYRTIVRHRRLLDQIRLTRAERLNRAWEMLQAKQIGQPEFCQTMDAYARAVVLCPWYLGESL